MNGSMITASVTMGQLQKKLDTISHNLANTDTPGFKSRHVSFSDLLTRELDNQPDYEHEEGRLTPFGIRVGQGARVSDTSLKMQQGTLKKTDRELDFALSGGNLMFQIQKTLENGQEIINYSREGSFYLSPSVNDPKMMQLVTSSGDNVLSNNRQPILIPANFQSISVDDQGSLSVRTQDGDMVNVGRIGLVEIMKPQALQSEGGNLYSVPDNLDENNVIQDEPALTEGSVQQGMLEQSNVNLSEEMTELITTQRSYQLNARAITLSDKMAGLINSIR